MQKLNLLPSPPPPASSHKIPLILQICRKEKKKNLTDCARKSSDCLKLQKGPNLWNDLITTYVKQGKAQHALSIYQEMQENTEAHPNEYAFVSLLKACRIMKDMGKGHEIHGHIVKIGLMRKNVFICSALIYMYAKCGHMVKAQEIFNQIEIRNVVSWTSLISGYVENGCIDTAMDCFERMQGEGIPPDSFTLVCILKACAMVGALDKGQEIHIEIARQGLLERNLYIGSILIDMYIKCNSLSKAQEVFDNLSIRNIVSWNAIIAGYAECGDAERALDLLKRIESEGISGDALTLVCCVKACGAAGFIHNGRELHGEIIQKGFLESDMFSGGALVDMYAKCGCLHESCVVFESLPFRTIVSWNAIIAGHAEYGYGEELAFSYFELMQYDGIPPDDITFLGILKACGNLRVKSEGLRMHSEIARRGLETQLLIGNSLVDMYAKVGSLVEAQEVFDKLSVQTVISWTTLITGYVEQKQGKEALHCLKLMQFRDISMNATSSICGLRACSSVGHIYMGQELHAEIIIKGLIDSHFLTIGSSLVDMYAKCGMLEEAHDMHNKIADRDVVTWTSLITGYAEHGYAEEALESYERMQDEAISPDAFIISHTLTACGSLGAFFKGCEIHLDLVKKNLENDVSIGECLVDMYGKCGSPIMAENVFNNLPVQTTSCWNALISGFAQLGENSEAFCLLQRMRREGVCPDLITFLNILNVCNYSGLIYEAQMWFETINNDYGFVPALEHFTCIVDMLGHAGQVGKAVNMIEKIPFHPNVVIWHTMLGACQKEAHLELGAFAFEQALAVNEMDAAAYVSLSNICIHDSIPFRDSKDD